MKTLTLNNGSWLQKITFLIAAGMISLNLQSQKSINNFEFQKFTDNLIKSTDQIMNAFAESVNTSNTFDEEIVLEDWMMDLDKWVISMDSGSAMSTGSYLENENFTEEDLKFEDWMFTTDWIKKEGSTEPDIQLNFEDWMLNPFEWSTLYCDVKIGRK